MIVGPPFWYLPLPFHTKPEHNRYIQRPLKLPQCSLCKNPFPSSPCLQPFVTLQVVNGSIVPLIVMWLVQDALPAYRNIHTGSVSRLDNFKAIY